MKPVSRVLIVSETDELDTNWALPRLLFGAVAVALACIEVRIGDLLDKGCHIVFDCGIIAAMSFPKSIREDEYGQVSFHASQARIINEMPVQDTGQAGAHVSCHIICQAWLGKI